MEENRHPSTLAIGVLLIVLGLFFFIGRVFDLFNQDQWWPFIVMGVGGALLAAAVFGGKSTAALAIPGAIVGGIGILLGLQAWLGLWESWSYAWALIIAFVGVGIAIFGKLAGRPESSRKGVELIGVGLTLFVIFGAIFELVFDAVGMREGRWTWLWAVLLISLGLAQLVVRAVRASRNDQEKHKQDLFGPVILIGIGVFFLLNRLGVLSGNQIKLLMNLWPLLLVVIGLNVMFGRRSPWVGAFLALLLLAALLLAAFFGARLGLPEVPSGFWGVHIDDRGININRTVITGSGVKASETRTLADVERVVLAEVGNLDVIIGDKSELVIEGDDNLVPEVTSFVSNGELVLGFTKGVTASPKQDLHYTLTVPELSAVTIAGLGNVTIDTLETNDLDLTVTGSGNIDIAELAAETITVKVSGLGSISVAGSADRLQIRIDGSGKFNGKDLQVEDANIRVSGLGTASIRATDTLDIVVSGSGNVTYYGDPTVVRQIDGIGRVTKGGD